MICTDYSYSTHSNSTSSCPTYSPSPSSSLSTISVTKTAHRRPSNIPLHQPHNPTSSYYQPAVITQTVSQQVPTIVQPTNITQTVWSKVSYVVLLCICCVHTPSLWCFVFDKEYILLSFLSSRYAGVNLSWNHRRDIISGLNSCHQTNMMLARWTMMLATSSVLLRHLFEYVFLTCSSLAASRKKQMISLFTTVFDTVKLTAAVRCSRCQTSWTPENRKMNDLHFWSITWRDSHQLALLRVRLVSIQKV